MVYSLLNHGVDKSKIVIGYNWECGCKFEIDNENKLCYRSNDLLIAFNNYDELNAVEDVFIESEYNFTRKGYTFTVIDIGMNIGSASIYFASRSDINHVYSYEPFKATYEMALQNIKRNLKYSDKITTFNKGLDEVAEEREITYNPGMSCAMSTNADTTRKVAEQYRNWNLINEGLTVKEKIYLENAANELNYILGGHIEGDIVLKIDCEGAEQGILISLDLAGLLKNISIIMLEWHYMDNTVIKNILDKNNFTYFSFGRDRNMGTIYAVRNS
jgi:FkbM family methyltransferase